MTHAMAVSEGPELTRLYHGQSSSEFVPKEPLAAGNAESEWRRRLACAPHSSNSQTPWRGASSLRSPTSRWKVGNSESASSARVRVARSWQYRVRPAAIQEVCSDPAASYRAEDAATH